MIKILRSDLAIFVLFSLIAFALFSPSLFNLNFFWDDERFVFLNPELTQAPSWYSFWLIKSEFYKTWPLGYSIFWAIIKYFPSASILSFKCLNITVHTINTWLLYRLLKLFKFTTPLLLAILFLVHPLNVESVSWIFQLLTLLSFTLFIASYFLILKYIYTQNLVPLLFAFLFFLFSLWTKSINLFAPFLFMITFWIFNLKIRKQLLLIPFLLLSFYIGAITLIGNKSHDKENLDLYNHLSFIKKIETSIQGIFSPSNQLSISKNEKAYFNFLVERNSKTKQNYVFQRSEILNQAPWHYLKKLFFPEQLQFIYPKIRYNFTLTIFALISFFLVPIILCIRTRKKKFLILTGFACVFLIPYLGLSKISFFYYSFVSDRYTYGLLLFVVFSIGFLIDQYENKFLNRIIIFLVTIISFQTLHYGLKFNNPTVLYEEILTYNKDVTIYTALFDQYLLKLDYINAERVLKNKIDHFPTDAANEVQKSQLENIKIFYDQN